MSGYFRISDFQDQRKDEETGETTYELGKVIEARCGVCGIEQRHFMSNEQLQNRDIVHAMHFHMWSQVPPLCSACKGTS